MNIFKRTKKYTEKDLVSFGNYLLSEKRNKSFIKSKNLPVLKERLSKVQQSDLSNWENS